MPKLTCRDYGFECDFTAQGEDKTKVIEEFKDHCFKVHAVEYSKDVLEDFINRLSN